MRRWLKKFVGALLILLLVLGTSVAALKLVWTLDSSAPESATGRREIAPVRTAHTMVVTAHPLATQAGVEILRAGGSAVDVAIAVQMVLTLVEPQSSGIGGGAFLLHYDRTRKRLEAYDGRETAPAAVDERLFLNADGSPYGFAQALPGGRSVGVPGVLRALELAHREHGRLPWRRLFEPAIALCQRGFKITPRLAQLTHKDSVLRAMPAARDYFYEADGRAKPAGTVLRNPELAQVLKVIADDGAEAFYRGAIAADIVAAVRAAHRPPAWAINLNFFLRKLGAPTPWNFAADVPNPGYLAEPDLANYRAQRREPVCRPYRRWRVCGFGPPSSGGVAVLETLGLLERFALSEQAANAPETLHRIAEAERLAFADRDRYLGDADFVTVPVSGLLDSQYLDRRSQLIGVDAAASPVAPGVPAGIRVAAADDASPEWPSTSHLSIVDAQGDVVSMTTSIEYAFGSHVMVRGFLLNNQLTDFSFSPGAPGAPAANAVAPGKRPRSSMAPMMVFDGKTGAPVLVLGSPGGSPIIGYVVRALLGVLDWGLTPQQAVELPHAVNRNGATELESEGWAAGELEAVAQALEKRGHRIEIGEMNSGLHAIAITPEGLFGGVDPRREGLAAGW